MPYWRLSGFYLFYFAALGAMLPYWTLYLKSLGLSSSDIGTLMAMTMATKIVSPNIWGWLADYTGRPIKLVRTTSLLTVAAFSGVFLGQSFLWLALVMTAFSFFWNATLPQVEATTLNHLGSETHRYTSIRLWGSIGFIATVAGMGPVLDQFGTGVLPAVLLSLFLGIWLGSVLVPEYDSSSTPHVHERLRKVLKDRQVLVLLLVCFLMQVSHGPYYTFYSIYLQEHDYTSSAIGLLWALGVIAEVVVFLVMHRFVPRWGLHHLLVISIALAACRWLLIALFVEYLYVMIFAQILHAATFGIYHGVAIQLIHRYFRGRHQGRGQAMYSSLSFGAGGAVGAWYSGNLWESAGATVTFGIAAAVSLLALIFAVRLGTSQGGGLSSR